MSEDESASPAERIQTTVGLLGRFFTQQVVTQSVDADMIEAGSEDDILKVCCADRSR